MSSKDIVRLNVFPYKINALYYISGNYLIEQLYATYIFGNLYIIPICKAISTHGMKEEKL